MSYDFDLYCRHTGPLPDAPSGMGFIVNADGPLDIEDEDISDNILAVIGKKRKLFQIHLEGQPDKTDQDRIELWLKDIVRMTGGVLVDLQQDTFETKTRSGKLKEPTTNNSESYLNDGSMSFHFLDGEWFYQKGFEIFLNLIATHLPEALPRRYGAWEPMQGKLDDFEFSDIIATYHEHSNLFWNAKTPFSGGSLSVMSKKRAAEYHPDHSLRREFVLSKCTIDLRPKAFANPAVMAKVMVFFEQASLALDVLYAQISKTDWLGPSYFWTGIPKAQTFASCASEVYYSGWPEFVEQSTKIGDRHRLCMSDRFGSAPPVPPAKLTGLAYLTDVICSGEGKGHARTDFYKLGLQPDERGHYW